MDMALKLGKPVNPSLHVGICGEHGGDPSSVEFCNKLGLDYVSCSPFRVPIARLARASCAGPRARPLVLRRDLALRDDARLRPRAEPGAGREGARDAPAGLSGDGRCRGGRCLGRLHRIRPMRGRPSRPSRRCRASLPRLGLQRAGLRHGPGPAASPPT